MLGSKKIQNNENSDLSPVNILKIKLFISQRKITPKKNKNALMVFFVVNNLYSTNINMEIPAKGQMGAPLSIVK